MLKYAGVTLDWYDDKGATLKNKFASLSDVPDVIKSASYRPPENLANEDFALVALDEGHVLRKFACYDPGSTAMSVIYFMEHGDKLPEEAQKLAAANLIEACGRFDLMPPEVIVKVARDMPSFTEQDRPEGVKKIYRALKREHPEMPAAMKARIAARQGKPGKQKQGPPYKGPLTKESADNFQLDPYKWAAAVEKDNAELEKQKAVKEHEATETPQEEMVEQLTGKEVKPGFKGPGFKVAAITGQRPKVKLAVAAPSNPDDYAVTLADGSCLYPIYDWDSVKLAEAYWLDNRHQMMPEMRRQFATKLAAKADQIGYYLDGLIKEAGSTTYAQEDHIRDAIDMRKVAFPRSSPEREFLDGLFEKRAAIEPTIFAEALRRFDVNSGLAQGWDHAVLDPWASTFGKEADTVIWEKGADRVTASQLHNLALNHSGGLREKFTTGFIDEFEKDPVALFNSMPEPQKRIIARLADDMAHSGRSESMHITADRSSEGRKAAGGR